ncbi:MAG: hypothetical protein K2M99_03405 [Treponemataceae bacterium]|nr:hypothetical protein [Treponemataceae bacterium]
MKKLLKNFAILTVFACGLFTGCNNDASIDLNVTVSTDRPSLDEPKNLGYGVLLTWGITQDANYFRITRQEKGGEEKFLYEVEGNRYFDKVNFYNELKEGVEYTYRVYNLGDKTRYNYEDDITTKDTFYYGDNCVVKTSYAERKITLQAGSLKKQGEKLEAINKDNVNTSFKNDTLRIYLNDEDRIGRCAVVVRDAETGKKVEEGKVYYYSSSVFFRDISAQKVKVEIKNVDSDDYYADSDVVTIENIENIAVEERIIISNLTATRKGEVVVLTWTTSEKIEPSEFKVLRTKQDSSSSKAEILKITPTSEELYNGGYYWTAIDETSEVGASYKYEVITTDSNSNPAYVSGQGLDTDISLGLYLNGSSVNYYSSISKETDEILLSFDNDDKNLTYKGYWTTVDNKGNESKRAEFEFTKDNDKHYRKVLNASEITDLNKAVSVNFYVKCYAGDKYVDEYNKSLPVSPSLTTYTSLNYISAYREDSSKRDITISVSGYNFDKVIQVTYFKDDGEVKTATLTWTKVSDSYYKATLTVAEDGTYTICATVPEDNAYSSSYSYEKTTVTVV